MRGLVAIVGEEALSEKDRRLLKFAEAFEDKFVRQDSREDRSIDTTLDISWKLMADIPKDELGRISAKLKDKYYNAR